MSRTIVAIFERNADHADALVSMLRGFPQLEILYFSDPERLLADQLHVDVYVLGLDDMCADQIALLHRLRLTQKGQHAGIALCSAKTEDALVGAFEEHDFDSFVSKDWVSPAQMYLAVTAALRSARWRLNHKCAVHSMANLCCNFTETVKPEAAE